jgi:H+-transporting ATPase
MEGEEFGVTATLVRTTTTPRGLSTDEARRRLAASGPNAVKREPVPAWRRFAARFSGPLPWILEATIVLTLVLGKDLEAAIIAALLVVNSVIGFWQTARAERALAAVKQRLAVHARVCRDEEWQTVAARDVVVDDVVRIRVGDIVPADLLLYDGHVSCDQAALTGESIPVDLGPDDAALGSSVVTRGEATAVVTATGAGSAFGRTSQLVQTAKTVTHLERVVFQVIKHLIVIDVALVAAMFGFALVVGTPLREILPFALIILIASVPVALPTTFTLAQAVGALELSKGTDDMHRGHGVFVTRLSAIQEAASMDVLCTDKTGTLTYNQLELAEVVAFAPTTEAELLELAARSADASGQDPIDLAILRAAGDGFAQNWERIAFQPFDPATKRTVATFAVDGQRIKVVKGMPPIVAQLCSDAPANLDAELDRLAATGARVLAVAAGRDEQLHFAGLVALADRPRDDSAQLVRELRDLGVDVKMITGDTAATAAAIADQVGIDRSEVFAGVLPEDKFDIVRSLQRDGRVVGMTGDGVNDAPALKQAEVGIAVDNAVDVAKAAAGMVLTEPGLVDVVAAVRVSRGIYQRMLTWTLNKIIKTVQVAVFLTGAFFLTRQFVTTPFLIVLLLFANDFVTMSLAVDRSRPSPFPDRWNIRALTSAALLLAGVVVAESFLDLGLARHVFGLSLAQTQTLMFVMLVFTGQATVYVVRERERFWTSRPVKWLLLATTMDVLVITWFAAAGIFMTAVPLGLVALVGVIAVAFMFVMDPIKVRTLRRLHLG